MDVLLTSDVLRAARSLLGLSQRSLEVRVELARSSIVAAESENSAASSTTIFKLRDFYVTNGLEFLGTIDVATGKAYGVGVRWRMPSQLPPSGDLESIVSTRGPGLAFVAARSLLNKQQSEIAAILKITEYRVRILETDKAIDVVAAKVLRSYYEGQGVEFLGWEDISRELYYGVGVRWKA